MTKKIKTISIKKNNQSYLTKLMIAYPKINSGRKNYTNQYYRVLKKGGTGFINIRSTNDYRYGKGKKLTTIHIY